MKDEKLSKKSDEFKKVIEEKISGVWNELKAYSDECAFIGCILIPDIKEGEIGSIDENGILIGGHGVNTFKYAGSEFLASVAVGIMSDRPDFAKDIVIWKLGKSGAGAIKCVVDDGEK